MDAWVGGCDLKSANPGLSYMEGVISGGKNCTTGNNNWFFLLFLKKSNKIHWKHAPELTASPFNLKLLYFFQEIRLNFCWLIITNYSAFAFSQQWFYLTFYALEQLNNRHFFFEFGPMPI